MRHRLLNFFAMLSLLLAVMVSGIWIWTGSHGRSITIARYGERNKVHYWAWASPESFQVKRVVPLPAPLTTRAQRQSWNAAHPQSILFAQLGIEALITPVVTRVVRSQEDIRMGRNHYPPIVGTAYGLTVPYWVPLTLFLFLPVLRIGPWVRTRWRIRAGRCVGCGYDLRATPERCPECGAVAGRPPSADSASSRT